LQGVDEQANTSCLLAVSDSTTDDLGDKQFFLVQASKAFIGFILRGALQLSC
jgi:hypothetical protein